MAALDDLEARKVARARKLLEDLEAVSGDVRETYALIGRAQVALAEMLEIIGGSCYAA